MYRYLRQTKVSELNTLQRSANAVYFSEFNELKKDVNFNMFSIKFVLEGNEKYRVNGTTFKLSNREYLLVNQYSRGDVNIESLRPVKGLCIDIDPQIIQNILASYQNSDAYFDAGAMEEFFEGDGFLENKYEAPDTLLGKSLMQISQMILDRPHNQFEFGTDFFYMLAGRIIEDHRSIFQGLYKIRSVKLETRKDLLRKLMHAKKYIDVNFSKNLNVSEIAKAARLSEYHFYRLFREAFSLSPQQYIIRKRLSVAYDILKYEKRSVSETAIMTGFGDIHSFSKSFRKYFGFSPSELR